MKIANTLFICLFCLASALPASGCRCGRRSFARLGRIPFRQHQRRQIFVDISDSQTKDVKVCGRASLSFSWKGRQDLQIDFKARHRQFDGTCTINGQRRRAAWKDEHIIIPNAYLRQGRNIIKINFYQWRQVAQPQRRLSLHPFVPDHARSVFPCSRPA